MSHGSILGQYMPIKSPVHGLESCTKLFLTLIVSTAAFSADDYVDLGLVTGFVVGLTVLSRVSAKQYIQSLRPMLVLAVVVVLIQALLNQAPGFTATHGVAINGEGLRQGLSTGLKLLLVCWVAQWLTFTTSPVKLTQGIEVLLAPWKRLGFPVEEVAMIATIAIRFVPIIFGEAEDLVKAQASRGADFESLRLQARLNSIISVLVPLVSRCWRRAEVLALAMEIRGYRVDGERSRFRRSKMGLIDYMYLAAGLSVLIWIRFTGGLG